MERGSGALTSGAARGESGAAAKALSLWTDAPRTYAHTRPTTRPPPFCSSHHLFEKAVDKDSDVATPLLTPRALLFVPTAPSSWSTRDRIPPASRHRPLRERASVGRRGPGSAGEGPGAADDGRAPRRRSRRQRGGADACDAAALIVPRLSPAADRLQVPALRVPCALRGLRAQDGDGGQVQGVQGAVCGA